MNGPSGKMERPTVEPFGRIPFRIVADGLLTKMTGADVKVFATIAAHAGKDWRARPSVKRIAELAGLSTRGVRLALARLQRLKVLAVEPGGGRGVANTYLLSQNPEAPFRVSGQTGNARGRKPESPSPETLNCSAQNPERPFTPTEGTEKEQNRTPGDAAADGIGAELARYGITEPKLSELASLPGLTAGMVRDLGARIRGKAANPAGLLVSLVQREGPQLVEATRSKAEARTRREAERQRNRQAEATARAEQEAEQARRLELVNGLSDAELAWRTDAALAAAGPFHGNRWRELVRRLGYRGAVLQNRGLRDAVCRPTGHT